MARAQDRADGVLVPVEPLYAAATFGLLSFDLFTTTGLRLNELMQTRVSKDCLVRLVDDPPPGAKDRTARIRYLFRLIPKGEKTETPRSYFIGKETLRLIEKTGRMLKEHYHLGPAEALPVVPFAPNNGRAHRFAPAPYLLQYRYRHLDGGTINSCIRFLLHGMIFETRESKPVVLKAHLLRHTFVTYAVQVAQAPIDIVAEWLKQKDLEVTRYYSQVPESFVAEEHGTCVTHLALQVNVREVFFRSPQEIREQAVSS
jgi:integrase